MLDSDVSPARGKIEDPRLTGKKRNAQHMFPTYPSMNDTLRSLVCHLQSNPKRPIFLKCCLKIDKIEDYKWGLNHRYGTQSRIKLLLSYHLNPKKKITIRNHTNKVIFFSSIKLGSYPWDKAYKPSSNILPNQLSFIFFNY